MWSSLRPSKAYYKPLREEKLYSRQRARTDLTSLLQLWKEAVIIALCILCAILTTELAFKPPSERDRAIVSNYRLTSEHTRWRQFEWNTKTYSSPDPKDKATVDAAWDRIVPAFGFVAVDHQWAAERNLPGSMNLPSDSSKGVYILDAYHQLHCLTIIRKTMLEIAAGKTPSKPEQHSWHCFDSLLQYILCGNSGDTLLYTWGRNETGDGQIRRCVDWNSRKRWVKANTACYMDGDHPIPLNDHFGHCEIDDDGLRMQW